MGFKSLVFTIVLLFAFSTAHSQPGNGKLEIHHIDMGQGDAAVLISPQGKVILLDAGLDIAHVKNCSSETTYLKSLGVKEIDAIFVSHYHSDHIGCIPEVLKEFPLVGPSYDRGESYDSSSLTYFNNYVSAVGGHRQAVTLGEKVAFDEGPHPVVLTVESLNGEDAAATIETDNENDLSVSVLVSFDGFREEIGGDLSGENTSNYQDIETSVVRSVGPLDVYKVHHHCSQYSTNEAWLQATTPTIAIISAGDKNSYRHPAEQCLERLHDSEIKNVYWTEEGDGGKPEQNDIVAGTVSVEVGPNATSYAVSYGNKSDTYAIKGSSISPQPSESTSGGDSSDATPPQPKYAFSAKGTVYYFLTCAAVKRISTNNLRYSATPPSGLNPSACVLAASRK
jgi:competence protein ComEC